MRKLGRVLALSWVISFLIAPALADEKLILKRGNLGPDHAFIRSFLDSELQPSGRASRSDMAYVGRTDLNKDGQAELFVFVAHTAFCGSVGCETHIFEKSGQGWKELTQLMVLEGSTDGPGQASLSTKDEGLKYLTLYSYYYGLRWNGKEYAQFCLGPCPR